MKGFDLAALAKEQMGVSKFDTAVIEEVQNIPVENISRNEDNFYQMSDIEELAGSIELCGLIHPVIVRDNGDGSYTLIDGERRLTAVKTIGLETIPAIVRRKTQSVIEELALIEANRQQRKMSPGEVSKQAERYTELLSQLKATGIDIPGRLRDRVAEAMQVSASKLGQLHAIREHLIPELLDKFDDGKINESVAYALSKVPEEVQQYLSVNVEKLPAWMVERCERFRKNASQLQCDRIGATCNYWKNKYASDCYASEKCCSECLRRAYCKDVCPHVQEIVAVEKADAEAEKRRLDAEREERERQEAEKFRKDCEASAAAWKNFKAMREAAGVSRKAVCDIYGDGYIIDEDDLTALEGDADMVDEALATMMPMQGLVFSECLAVSDLLGVSIARLAGRPEAVGVLWVSFADKLPDGGGQVVTYGDKGFGVIPAHLAQEYSDAFPENYKFWAVIEPPKEDNHETV